MKQDDALDRLTALSELLGLYDDDLGDGDSAITGLMYAYLRTRVAMNDLRRIAEEQERAACALVKESAFESVTRRITAPDGNTYVVTVHEKGYISFHSEDYRESWMYEDVKQPIEIVEATLPEDLERQLTSARAALDAFIGVFGTEKGGES